MKKVYLATMLSLAMTTAHAQEPNIPMFAGQQQIDVKFNDYKAGDNEALITNVYLYKGKEVSRLDAYIRVARYVGKPAFDVTKYL